MTNAVEGEHTSDYQPKKDGRRESSVDSPQYPQRVGKTGDRTFYTYLVTFRTKESVAISAAIGYGKKKGQDTKATDPLCQASPEQYAPRHGVKACEHRHASGREAAHSLKEAVQVGGVWTPPELRGRGHGRSVVAASLLDARSETAEKALLFTGKDNIPAQKAYTALGFRQIGDYRILLVQSSLEDVV